MSKILYTAAEVDAAIDKLAENIITDYTASKPVFVALLRGAVPFASKLMFAIARQSPSMHPEVDYMMVSTYGRGRSAGTPEIVTDLAPTTNIAGRRVIILDDVLDKGITADFVTQHLLDHGATDVELAVLVDKQTERLKPVSADYACLNSPDTWLAGMGMDDDATGTEAYRWHQDIVALSHSSSSADAT